jgi:hypothetical protein
MQQNNDFTDLAIQKLYSAWCEAELYACIVFEEIKEDYSHPRYVEAYNKAHAMLLKLLKPSTSLHGALIKLKIASYFEGYLSDVENPECTTVAPQAVISAIQDLETIIASASVSGALQCPLCKRSL